MTKAGAKRIWSRGDGWHRPGSVESATPTRRSPSHVPNVLAPGERQETAEHAVALLVRGARGRRRWLRHAAGCHAYPLQRRAPPSATPHPRSDAVRRPQDPSVILPLCPSALVPPPSGHPTNIDGRSLGAGGGAIAGRTSHTPSERAETGMCHRLGDEEGLGRSEQSTLSGPSGSGAGMRDTKRSDLSVEGPSGERRDLAIRLLAEGRASVMVGDLLIYRERRGPSPDPAAPLVVEADGSRWWRPALPRDYRQVRAENQLAEAVTRTAALGRADPRFPLSSPSTAFASSLWVTTATVPSRSPNACRKVPSAGSTTDDLPADVIASALAGAWGEVCEVSRPESSLSAGSCASGVGRFGDPPGDVGGRATG